MINSENARRAFIRRIGNLSCAEKEYFDLFHKELNPDEYIDAALNDCRGYFGTDNIPFAVTDSCVADIAYIRYQIDIAQSERPYGLKSASYSEGSVSKSETYSSDQELNTSIESILKPYSRFRVVSGHKKMKTPNEWTLKTFIYPKSIKRNGNYNFDISSYSNIPSARLNLCWQPVEDNTSTQERGTVTSSSYTAVVYDDTELSYGDMVKIDGLGYFLVTSIKKYITYRLVTVRSTDRRIESV